jgi:hypothetical protein
MFYRIGFLVLLTAALIGCGSFNINAKRGSGKVTIENRAVNNFHSVVLAGIGDLTIMQSDSESLTITAEDNLLPLLTSEVKDGVLTIGVNSGINGASILPTQPIKYELHVNNLDSIQLSGAGNILAPALQSETLKLGTSGAGNVNLSQLAVKQLAVALSGAGNMTIAGQGDTQQVTVAGFGSYNAGDFKTNTTDVTLTGAGSATVWAEQTLNGKISGAGSINYYGSPQVTSSVGGVGAVKQLGTK